MATRERPIDRGRRIAAADRMAVGREIRVSRQVVGKSLEEVSRASRVSSSQVSLIERGEHRSVTVERLAVLGATVGLDVRIRAYPGPDPSLDAGQVAALNRLRYRLHPRLAFRTEVPLPISGDQRAWDAMISKLTGVAFELPVDVDTRMLDIQAQVRRVMLKLRDSGLGAVLFVLADTRRNRAALGASGAALSADFPVPARRALKALAEGQHPEGSALVLL
jgi:transcriptional regulator with XRE-family HTH domain